MSLKLVEVVVLGQVLRLNVPAEQEEILRQAARNLDLQVSEMKDNEHGKALVSAGPQL